MISISSDLAKIAIMCLFGLACIPTGMAFGDFKSINVPLTYYPGDITIDPITNNAYVANSGYVTVINGTTNTSFNIPVGSSLWGIAANPKTGTIYTTETISNTVYVIDEHTNKIIQKISLPLPPTEISVNSNTNMVYVIVLNGTRGGFYVINGTTNKIIDSVSSLGNSTGISVNSVTDKIYISNFSVGGKVPQTVSVIDGSTNNVVDTIILGHANCLSCTMPTSGGDMPIAVNPVTNTVYAGNFNDGIVSVINGTNDGLLGSMALSTKSLAIDYEKNLIYAAGGPISKDGESHYISIINGSDNTVTNKMLLSDGVIHMVTVNPVTGIVYGVNSGPIPSVTIMDYDSSDIRSAPEFSLTIPILLISIASLIAFYRIKIRK